MNFLNNETAHSLLSCFLEECESRFRFLELDYGFSYLSGLLDYENNRFIIKSFNEKNISQSFQKPAITRYEKDQYALDILFDRDRFLLHGFLYIDSIHRLNINDVLAAAKRERLPHNNKKSLLSENDLKQAVKNLAIHIRKHTDLLANPPERLIERTFSLYDTRLEHTIRKHYSEGMIHAVRQSAQAFQSRNYQRVIELLGPYELNLGRSDLKKLKIAREQVSSVP